MLFVTARKIHQIELFFQLNFREGNKRYIKIANSFRNTSYKSKVRKK